MMWSRENKLLRVGLFKLINLRLKFGENKKFRKSSEKVGSNLIAESFAKPLINEFGPPEFSSVTAPTLNKLYTSKID